ncbi:RNA polymerase sigma factor [Pelagicoccus sp. SDUM812003]|uniref:RNA polymerase sigma factor n=1 Tax=Pelagicoccus sp. SDUM812003 TaxID=3041267 RepID=UPI00280E7EEB|nr:RNA polymerase sigma factor [Pelagicoccus sp. SDUM812003]MDQ8203410.1 RNA polymerase sigma factor [Pelagicoccus sp. SDUM812003]
MTSDDDNELMGRARKGDLDGIGILFERYHGSLVGFFRRVDGRGKIGEDLAQETFWRIVRYRKSFDGRRPFRAWMFQIARNVMNDHLRKSMRAGKVMDPRVELNEELAAQPDSDVSAEVERGERKELLREALSRLPLEKRELIVLCRFEELPYAEIAPMFGCSVGALKVRLFRALKELKEVFIQLGGEKTA